MREYDKLIRKRYELEQAINNKLTPQRKRRRMLDELIIVNAKMAKLNGSRDRVWLTKEEDNNDDESRVQGASDSTAPRQERNLHEKGKPRRDTD